MAEEITKEKGIEKNISENTHKATWQEKSTGIYSELFLYNHADCFEEDDRATTKQLLISNVYFCLYLNVGGFYCSL